MRHVLPGRGGAVWPKPGGTGPVGGWQPVKDMTDPQLHQIAAWAVAEANREQHLTGDAAYHAVSVQSAQTQVVAGTNYRLQIQVDHPSAQVVEAVVFEKPWNHSRTLTSFTPKSASTGTVGIPGTIAARMGESVTETANPNPGSAVLRTYRTGTHVTVSCSQEVNMGSWTALEYRLDNGGYVAYSEVGVPSGSEVPSCSK
ncbi:cystatin domain-containing protein [Streptomyces sp. AK02-04a]|nr:cystatin domain-containing protein [Streptomyces sp. AK02-04a]